MSRGAVHRGLEGNQVENRKARCHYGVEYSTTFNPVKHEGQTPYWCEYQERQLVDGQMQWYIQKVLHTSLPVTNMTSLLTLGVVKGESLSERNPIKLPFYRIISLTSSCVFHDDLCMSVDENAPGTRTTSKLSKCPPQQLLIGLLLLARCQKGVRGGIRFVKDPEGTVQQVQKLLGAGVL